MHPRHTELTGAYVFKGTHWFVLQASSEYVGLYVAGSSFADPLDGQAEYQSLRQSK